MHAYTVPLWPDIMFLIPACALWVVSVDPVIKTTE